MSSVPTVGLIFNPPKYLPPFTQPGGIGTATLPQQMSTELLGQWMSGCGHSFNNWLVYSCQVGGVQTAVVCCPLCNYCNQLISPYSAIESYPNEIIFGALLIPYDILLRIWRACRALI
jgi:hypothetical protein